VRGISVRQRGGLEAAVEVIGPAVVAAAEFGRVAAVRGDHHRAAMGALVREQLNGGGRVANEQQRLAPDPRRQKISGIFDLALVPDIDPCRAENSLELQLEDVRVGVDASVHPARPDQGADIVAGNRRHGRLPLDFSARGPQTWRFQRARRQADDTRWYGFDQMRPWGVTFPDRWIRLCRSGARALANFRSAA